ncbi:putative response regulatory protein [Polaribacter huanghezhanensis]|uniref:helix-turn-helix domain-containing protein n=1 Tax=Polaribacter huanghezhanensis TaxID=1354726 RepID=UPI002647944C|nr:helix-turn-helix transcriptional regulator [Polaribacter huanghezhanensis]WKD85072.1 putative response regulatory protein [Polaribacter huanghezhanensis]
MLKTKTLLFTLTVFSVFSLSVSGQQQKDTMLVKTYNEFHQLFRKSKEQSKKYFYANKLIEKARKENNLKELIVGYQLISTLFKSSKETKIKYLDSIIRISKDKKEYDFFTASVYLEKGGLLYSLRDFKRSLDNYLLVLKHTENKFLKYKANYSIGVLKDRTGDHYGALKINKENFYFSKKYHRGRSNKYYLNSIYALANTFNYLEQLDSASFYNKLGTKESLLFNEKRKYIFFVLNQGTTHYLAREYQHAIDSLKLASKLFKSVNDKVNYAEANYYLGKSYAKINLENQAISSFKIVDTIFIKKRDLLPVMRDSYEYLINYYKEKKDLKNQLIYINQLMKLDSILHLNELYLNKNIIKEFEIPRLMKEKEEIIKNLTVNEKKYWNYFYALLIVLLLSLISLFYQNKKRILYKKRFNNLINESVKPVGNRNPLLNVNVNLKKINIPGEIVEKILFQLNEFEKESKYISTKITLQNLAKEFDSNTSYLSKVVNEYKKMSFAKYINNLRIEFATNQLKTNDIFRKYTIKAIAEEVGFNNSESFSKAFYKINGIQPSYFIKELEKRKKNS